MFKRIPVSHSLIIGVVAISIALFSCQREPKSSIIADHSMPSDVDDDSYKSTPLSEEFKDYWYSGEAEISSYRLEQARYGEIRQGKAVLIYVTEDFLPDKQVKAEQLHDNRVSVLKLNATKNFNTGIYPYATMQSTFYPVSNRSHALKVTSSMQEWCGHVYAQLNTREQIEVTLHSYFENEADQEYALEKSIMENELWTKLRIDPKSLPTGELDVIPSFEFSRFQHVPIKPFKALATLDTTRYTLQYPELNRTLAIDFNPHFPYDIISWEETFKSGFGVNQNILTSRATRLKSIKSAYWKKNRIDDEVLRDTLHLN
ncbi:septum formation inhibitor Maf [Aestuariivivens sediminicola]|uniref:septum formation inhibitor Maf n=1 Tax=Aestuariivivens sediminicola TaxID=2913560 RepID=UPI001F57E9CC|nr:septum formation inhibitor Maf [Aestuariivivens sediminicola]